MALEEKLAAIRETFSLDGWLVGVVRRTHQEGEDRSNGGTSASARRAQCPQLELSRDIRTHVLPHVPRVRESALASPALGSAMSAGVSALASPRALAALALRGAGACTS